MASKLQPLVFVTEERAHSVRRSSALETSMISQKNILVFKTRLGSHAVLTLRRRAQVLWPSAVTAPVLATGTVVWGAGLPKGSPWNILCWVIYG